jgi:hypothetical protein
MLASNLETELAIAKIFDSSLLNERDSSCNQRVLPLIHFPAKYKNSLKSVEE